MRKKKKIQLPKPKTKKNSRRYFDILASSLFFLFCFLLPAQLGRHFFLSFSYISGIRIDYLAPTLYLTDILAIILILLHIKKVLIFFRSRKVLFLMILIFISGTFAISKPLFLYRFLKLIEFLALFSVFKNEYPKYKKAIIAGFAFSVFFQIPLIVGQLVTRHSFQGMWYFFGERYMSLSTPGIAKASLNGTEFLRPYGTFSHPNSLAGFFLVLYFFFLTNKQITNNILKYTVLAFSSFIIFFSFSKNAILVYLTLNFLYSFWEKTNCRVCRIAKIVSPFFLAAIFLFARTDPESFSKRAALIKESLIIISRHPLTGTGLGNYLLASFSFPIKYPYFFLQPVHNIFLLFLAETGFVVSGTSIFLLYRFVVKNAKYMPFLFIFLAVFLTGMNDHYWITLQQNWLLMGAIFGIIVI